MVTSSKTISSYLSKLPWISFAFILTGLYWAYLFCTTQMIIAADSIGYEELGQLLQKGNFLDYFKTGPNREPLYPLIISLSMSLGDLFSVPYQTIQKFIQLLALFSSQWLLFILLTHLRIHRYIIAGIILYFGFSPVIVNSAFSLYSENITFPILLALILLSAKTFEGLKSNSSSKTFLYAILTSLGYLLIIFTKGVYEIIFYLYLIPFISLLIFSFLKKNKCATRNTIITLLTLIVCVQGVVVSYKLMNKKYSQVYSLTDRGPWALYASCARRALPLSTNKFLALVALNFNGPHFCFDHFGEETCSFWGHSHLDELGSQKRIEISRNFPKDQVDKELIAQAKKKVLAHPFQFSLLMLVDSMNMFTWEPIRIGFAVYPDWLENILDNTLFRYSRRLLITWLSIGAFLTITLFMLKRIPTLLTSESSNTLRYTILLFTWLIVFSHVSIHALFMTIARFALPLGPLYLILIGASLHILLFGKKEPL